MVYNLTVWRFCGAG